MTVHVVFQRSGRCQANARHPHSVMTVLSFESIWKAHFPVTGLSFMVYEQKRSP